MARYFVTIEATVRKTLVVEADNKQDAIELAHEDFSVAPSGDQEHYSQETVEVRREG
jgi:hypothetical protein